LLAHSEAYAISWLGKKGKERPVTTRTEELLAEGVITRLDVMVQETSATVAGLNKLLPQADRLEDMLVEVHDAVTRPVEETGFAELLTELQAISVSNAEVLHRLDERSHRQTELLEQLVAHLTKAA
jgi:hypothetical protein